MDRAGARRLKTQQAATRITLVLAAVLGLAMAAADRVFDYPTDPSERLAELEARPARANAVAALFLASQFLLLPGVLFFAAHTRHRGGALATAGASALVLGIFGHAVVGGANLVRVDMARLGRDADAMQALFQASENNPVYLAFAGIGFLGFLVGVLLFSIALLRGGEVILVWPAALILGVLVEFSLASVPFGSLAGMSIFAIGLIGLAVDASRFGPHTAANLPAAAAAMPPFERPNMPRP